MSPTFKRPRAVRGSLRDDVLRFLAFQTRPAVWTWFRAASSAPGIAPAGDRPDLVIEVAGRVVYVEIRAPHQGPLPAARRAWQAAARYRGAAIATVRSVPDVENLLAGLGVRLRKPKFLAAELADTRRGRKVEHGKIETRTGQKLPPRIRRSAGAPDTADRGPAAL